MKIKLAALIAALAGALLLAGCADGETSSSGRLSVVASFYPFAYAAERVGGDLVDVDNLTSPGAEPHDLELKPRQVGALIDADLVVYEKDFQAAVDTAVDQADRDDDHLVEAGSLVDLIEADDEEHDHDHDGDDGHDHGDIDPHIWLDPTSMVAVAEAIASKLSALDPDHAETFAANAERFTTELERLDDDFRTGLARCETRDIVTSHAAFAYLARRYDLHQIPIAGIEPSNEPSPAQLAEITDHVRDHDITTIFTEELVSPAVAQTVAKATGASVATLDPIEGLGDATADQTYLTLMTRNLETLVKANRCT